MLHTVSDLLSYILPSPKVSSNRIGIGTDMMDGIVEVKSTHLDIGKTFRDRRVVVRPTLLSCLKTANESIPSIILDDKNDFPLPSAKFIQFIQSKENALVLVVKCKFQFMDKKVKELTDHKNANILKEITIRFPDSHSRYRWLKSIIPICEKNYLREVVFDQFSNLGDETFFKDAYTELWARILLDWPHLDSIRMVFTLVKGSLSATLILQTLLRVLRWMEVLMKLQEEHVFTKEHAGVFVRFFIQAVTNHGFRVLLFLFEPVTSFLDDFFKNSNAVLRSELSRESLSSHTEEVRDPAFLLKQFLLYVDHLANNILNIHRLIFQKAHHPLETVAELSLWPQTERCAQEIEWNEKVRCEPLSWTMMNSILRDPPFLPYKLIMKEFNSVISDDSVDRVVQLLQDLPLSYFSMSFDSLKMKTKETHGRHFQNLASFCKFREVWKIFAVNQLSLLLTDEISYRFADATFRQAWGYITNHNPRFMKRMFLLENFESVSDYEENSIEEALHGQIFIRLAQHDERTVKVFKLGGVQLPDMTTTKFQCSETLGGSLTVEQRVFLQVEKVQYLSSRIIQWIESLTQRPVGSQANGEFDAKAFVILWNCCIESFIFRAFLLITKPSVGTLDYFTADHSILETFGTQSQLDPLVRFALFITERVLPLRSKSFLSFLKLFSHPFSIDIFSVETFKLSWNAEIAWMKELEKYYGKDWNGFEMSYSEIKKSLSETQFFTFQLFLCNSRSKSVLQNLKLLERIPHDIIYGSFGFYRFNGEFAINEKNYFNPRFALCADLEMFDDSHFLSLLSMFRLINVWESISPHSNFGESPSMANALISALWATFSTGRKDEDRALVNFFYPMTEFSKSYRGFQDMLPLLISTAVLQEDPVLKTIFKIVNPKILNIIDRNQFSIITTAEKAGLRSFLSLLFIWLLTFIGYSEMDQITDFKAFAEIFVLILEQSIYCFTFRAVVCTLNLEFGVADKISAVKGDDLLRTAKKLIQQFINVSTIEGSKEAQVQSLGYFLHSCGHPVAQKSGQNHYIFREISWSDEISWINKSRVPWNMSVSDFEHFLSSATSLCFKYFICTRRKSGRDDLSELVKYIEYIPQLLIKESFECSTEHLLSNNHTQLAINERSIKGRHFISLFKQPIFQELWNLFFIPRMRPTAFVQKVYFLIWENVIAHDRSCKKMFHLADSRREIAVINFINLLQCKLLLALNKSGNIGIEQLLCDVDQMEILEMKKIVALDGDSILKSSLESVIFRIVQWTQCLCSQSNPDLSESACLLQELTADDAILFVELLDACIQDSLFRVLLFLFLPSTSLVPEFAKYSTQTLVNETHRQKAIKLIRYICETISGREWILHRKSLTILSYPKPDFNGVCEPSWKQEQAWIEELTLKRTPDLRIGWQELQCCLLPGAALSYIILTKIINDKYRSEIIQDLSSDYLTSSFALEKMTRISDDYHFYYLCLLEHRTEPEEFRRKEAVASDGIFSVFVKYQLVNDLFIERILTFACANPNQHLLSAFEILRDLIITTNADDEPILCIDTLSMFSNICQIVIDAIYEAANARTVTGSKLIMCRIIELLLLLENTMDTPKLGNLIHLSKLFYLKVVYKSKVELPLIFPIFIFV